MHLVFSEYLQVNLFNMQTQITLHLNFLFKNLIEKKSTNVI